jgi:hypothetical protein
VWACDICRWHCHICVQLRTDECLRSDPIATQLIDGLLQTMEDKIERFDNTPLNSLDGLQGNFLALELYLTARKWHVLRKSNTWRGGGRSNKIHLNIYFILAFPWCDSYMHSRSFYHPFWQNSDDLNGVVVSNADCYSKGPGFESRLSHGHFQKV